MNNINLLYANLKPLYSDFDKFLARISPKNRPRILSMKDFDAKVHSLGGMLLLNEAAIRLGVDFPEVLYTDKGRPYLKNNDFYFSISHSGGYAACSFGNFKSGCDIQVKRPVNLKIADRYFSEPERKKIFESHNLQDEFFKIWCFRESAYKLTGYNDCVIENKHNVIFRVHNVSDDFYLVVCAFENVFEKPEKIKF